MLQMVGKQVAAARKTAKGRRLSYRYHDRFNAFTYNQTGFGIKGNKLSLSKIGSSIKIVLHRRRPVNVKQVTICRKKDGRWYAVVACEILRKQYSRIVLYSKPVGVDVGIIAKFAHDSDNHVIENPQFLTSMHAQTRQEGASQAVKKAGRQQQS